MRKLILVMMALGLACTNATASKFGYCKDELGRTNMFRMGSTDKQGLAIRLSHDKLQAMKGVTISGIEVAFGSRNTDGKSATLFITKRLNNAAGDDLIAEKTVTITKAISWLQYDITPYTITGDEEELYIGYHETIGTSYKSLMSDFTADIKGYCYAYNNGTWTDIYGNGFGAACIRLITSDYQTKDLMAKAGTIDGYFKVGNNYDYSGQIINIGTETITSFDLTVNNNGTETTTNYTGLSIAQGDIFDYTISQLKSESMGNRTISATISNVNGTTDSDPSDNRFESPMFFYPEKMEKCELLEVFTGQACPNCPTGHLTINKDLSTTSAKVVEVMHHAGYQPDIFTTNEDLDYTVFYGSTSTFAPAAMVNRTTLPLISAVPVFNVDEGYVAWALEQMSSKQPYASLKLNTTYDKDTREVRVDLTAYIHNDLPADNNLINVVVTQDNLIAKQSNGGTQYNHSKVFRESLTGNSWGLLIPADETKAGSTITWNKTFTLPEAYRASGWTNAMLTQSGYTEADVTTTAVAEDINIVAYIGGYKANDFVGHEVFNSIETKLGSNAEQGGCNAIHDATNDHKEIGISISEGKISVDADNYSVYDMTGKTMSNHSPLPRGVYIVKAICNGKVFTKKVAIR